MKTKLHINGRAIFTTILLLFSAAFTLVKAETAYALWCSSTATMYFTTSTIPFKAGQTYDGATITNVWSGNLVESSGIQPQWNFTTSTITAQQFYACTGNNVNVRKGPGKQYGVIRQIWKGCGVGDGFVDCEHETGNYVIEYRGKKRNGFILVAVLGEGINIEGWISAQYLRPICRHCDGYPKTYDSCDAENPKLLYTCRYCRGRGY